MKANELRIGNWVEITQPKKGIYTTVEQSTFSTNIENNFKPIPLTEEWLLKFGFTNNNVDSIYEIKNYYLEYIQDGNLNFYFFEYGEWFIKIAHVHKLQNLYFALTGEELTIKQS
jgi:hypothetical protein